MCIFIFPTIFSDMDSNKHYDRGLKYSNSSKETLQAPNSSIPLELTAEPVLPTMIHAQIMQDEDYLTHEHLLEGSEITPNMRAKVRHFLMLECEKQKYLRETCALACSYVDLYFLHRGKVTVADFQTLAIGCLILASKISEKRYPVISPTFCRIEELNAWELGIARCLNYRLNPCTHVIFAQRILMAWSQFRSRNQLLQSPVYQAVNDESFYEILDLIFMVVESLKFDIEQLVVNLFYLLVRKTYLGGFQQLLLLPEKKIMPQLYCHDYLSALFQEFLVFYSSKKARIQPELGMYLLDFIAINHVQQKRNLQTKMKCQNMHEFPLLQTLPDKAYETTKKLVNCRIRSKKLTCKAILKTLEAQK